ncbi:MAG: hypothetical protein CXZ00_16320 [Acidobacteria bacterium]|nr:MAG: hypothetical protein CXZ00_16320 [Acidobacteriota bacterium]
MESSSYFIFNSIQRYYFSEGARKKSIYFLPAGPDWVNLPRCCRLTLAALLYPLRGRFFSSAIFNKRCAGADEGACFSRRQSGLHHRLKFVKVPRAERMSINADINRK